MFKYELFIEWHNSQQIFKEKFLRFSNDNFAVKGNILLYCTIYYNLNLHNANGNYYYYLHSFFSSKFIAIRHNNSIVNRHSVHNRIFASFYLFIFFFERVIVAGFFFCSMALSIALTTK